MITYDITSINQCRVFLYGGVMPNLIISTM
jgi:hypothetical protein